MHNKLSKAAKRKHDKAHEKYMVGARAGELTRARSVSVGIAFGGVTEIIMRQHDGSTVWAVMQPVETIELIHQLAANVGCHIRLQPRDDFASWRSWRDIPENNKHLNDFTDPTTNTEPYSKLGVDLPSPEKQPGLQPALMAKEKQDEQPVATEKAVGRKRTKRATKTT